MFTPLSELQPDEQRAVLRSLDAPEAWIATWDIGLTDPGDAFSKAPLWGRTLVSGRWPTAFPKSNHNGECPWRTESHVPFGHVHPNGAAQRATGSTNRRPRSVAKLQPQSQASA